MLPAINCSSRSRSRARASANVENGAASSSAGSSVSAPHGVTTRPAKYSAHAAHSIAAEPLSSSYLPRRTPLRDGSLALTFRRKHALHRRTKPCIPLVLGVRAARCTALYALELCFFASLECCRVRTQRAARGALCSARCDKDRPRRA